MNVRKKTLITIGLVIVIIGVIVLQSGNTDLFRGQMTLRPELEEELIEEGVEIEVEEDALPDLKAELEVLPPEETAGDIQAKVTISNLGPGNITKEDAFRYAVFINDQEIFSNLDSFTEMGAGDSFSFVYPISRSIYQYEDEGTVTVKVDTENIVEEVTKDNNLAEVRYSF